MISARFLPYLKNAFVALTDEDIVEIYKDCL